MFQKQQFKVSGNFEKSNFSIDVNGDVAQKLSRNISQLFKNLLLDNTCMELNDSIWFIDLFIYLSNVTKIIKIR